MAIIFLENKLQERKDKKMQNSYQSDKLCAMTDIELTERFRNAVKIENKIKILKIHIVRTVLKQTKNTLFSALAGAEVEAI